MQLLLLLLQARELVLIRDHQLIRSCQVSSEVIRCHQRLSEVIRRYQKISEVIRGHQRSLAPAEAPTLAATQGRGRRA